jgi:hypothetical protein
MATSVFPGSNRSTLTSRKTPPLPSLSEGKAAYRKGDLTIHRITETHHGRTLLMLGHAAEYLVNSRRYSTKKFDQEAHVEAVHLLMRLGRSVFEEYAELGMRNRRLEGWVVERAVRLIEGRGTSDNRRVRDFEPTC